MYGTQTETDRKDSRVEFENDVKMYGTQTAYRTHPAHRYSLRMM